MNDYEEYLHIHTNSENSEIENIENIDVDFEEDIKQYNEKINMINKKE